MLGIDSAAEVMDEIPAERIIVQKAEEGGEKNVRSLLFHPWRSHTRHNPHSAPPSYDQDDVPENPVFELPISPQGLPLPPDGYKPPLQNSDPDSNPFGHYAFASLSDLQQARDLNFAHASAVVHAAHHGYARLNKILLKWIPGHVEGSQEPRFGPCNAYIHIYMINSRREFWFNKGPVPLGELPVYTGTDPLWLERRGADGTHLDQNLQLDKSVHMNDSYYFLPVPDSGVIEEQILARQGYRAQAEVIRTGFASRMNQFSQERSHRTLFCMHAIDSSCSTAR